MTELLREREMQLTGAIAGTGLDISIAMQLNRIDETRNTEQGDHE